ncbi:MAG TPA: hypothetical protein VH637_17175 [Streptosporangiaceae bacterium]|jgi:hypothetical protein
MPRSRRAAALVTTTAALLLGAAACGSGQASPDTSASPGTTAARDSDAMALLIQCGLSRGAPSVVQAVRAYDASQPARLRFTEGGNLRLTRASYPVFVAWYQSHASGLVVAGQPLDRWQQKAAASGALPAAVCGAGVSARQLHDQVYAQYPTALKNNPWSH